MVERVKVGKIKNPPSPLLAIRDADIETAKRLIEERYGFVPPDIYVRDLIKFVQEMLTNVSRN